MAHARCPRALWLPPFAPSGRLRSCAISASPADVSRPLDISITHTHIWESELSPWCHLFVLLPTPRRVSVWNRKIIPLVNILREKEPIFTRACCKYRKLESKLNLWTVVSKNKASFSSYWQADRQLLQSNCRPVAFRLEGFWLFVADSACDCTDHRHFQHPVDHSWPSCACFLLGWLVYLLPTVWFPWEVWKLSPSFYYCPSEQHLMSCVHLPAVAAGTDLCCAGVFIALWC